MPLAVLFSIGFFIALILSTYFNILSNINVIKFAIPLLIFVLALFHLLNNQSSKKYSLAIVFTTVFLFAFLNGLGVYNNLENEFTRNISKFTPILLTVLGASGAVLGLMIVVFLIKNLLIKIKKISETKWIYGLSLISCCIAMFLLIGKVFI